MPSDSRFDVTARKKPKQVAVVATARKMLKVVYWMLKRGEEYRP